jgi:hypothetical protein
MSFTYPTNHATMRWISNVFSYIRSCVRTYTEESEQAGAAFVGAAESRKVEEPW